MAIAAESGATKRARVVRKGRPTTTAYFDWGVLIASVWLLVGGYSDAWAHTHFDLETFFTPWHGILYSGFMALLIVFMAGLIWNWRKGYPLYRALPEGYHLSLSGLIGFLFGGVGDLVWHTLFGVESGIEGVLSPTHATLGLCYGLVISGPFRSAWRTSKTACIPLTAFFSLAYLIAIFTLMTHPIHPAFEIYAMPAHQSITPTTDISAGVQGIVIETILFMGLILLTLRRWTLPLGSMTFFLMAGLTGLSFMSDHFLSLPVALVAGILCDVALVVLKPSRARPAAFRQFAFIVPVITFSLYFAALNATTGVWWTVHVWVGAIVLAGTAGWLLSYLVLPPPMPPLETE